MTKHRIFSDRYGLLMLLDLAVCLLYGIFFLAHPPVLKFLLPDQQDLIVWSQILIHRYRWPLMGMGVALSFLAIGKYYAHELNCQRRLTPSSHAKLLHYLMPLSLLPWVAVILLKLTSSATDKYYSNERAGRKKGGSSLRIRL